MSTAEEWDGLFVLSGTAPSRLADSFEEVVKFLSIEEDADGSRSERRTLSNLGWGLKKMM